MHYGEDFISENTPLMNNDPLVVPLCNETDLFISPIYLSVQV
jgi:hypothetical protein